MIGGSPRRGYNARFAHPSAANPPAIVLGGRLTALSLARSLAAEGVSVRVLDRRNSPARLSRAVAEFVDVGGEMPQTRMLAWLRSHMGGGVVLAGSDDGLELIAGHRAELLQLGYLPMEADDAVLVAMLDKAQSYELARAGGIAVPEILPLRDRHDLEDAIERVEFPCVVKPVHSHLFAHRTGSATKVLHTQSPGELRAVFEKLSDLGLEMFVTEVVRGASDECVSYFGYLDESGDSLLDFTKRKLRQQPPGFGIGTYHESTHDSEVAEHGRRFLQAVGLRGLGNVEFKRDSRDGKLKLIECNARFTMSNEVIRAAGIDLATFSYNRLLGRPTPPVASYRAGVRLWDPVNDTRAFLAYRRMGELSSREWLASLAHHQRFPAASLADPLPAVHRTALMLYHAASRDRGNPTLRTTRDTTIPAGQASAGLGVGRFGRRGVIAGTTDPSPRSSSGSQDVKSRQTLRTHHDDGPDL